MDRGTWRWNQQRRRETEPKAGNLTNHQPTPKPTSLVSLLSWTKSRSNIFLFSPLSVSGVLAGLSITLPPVAYKELLLHLAEEEDKVVVGIGAWGRKRPPTAAAAGVALCPPQKKAWATPTRVRRRRRRGTCRLMWPAMVLCGCTGVGCVWDVGMGGDRHATNDEEDTSVSTPSVWWEERMGLARKKKCNAAMDWH